MITEQTARKHARRLVHEIEETTRAQLAQDPSAAVVAELGLTLREVPAGDVRSGCPIDGYYDHDAGAIVVAAAASPGRRNFSILHELGHRLVLGDDELGDLLWEHDNAEQWEERICDAIAGELLIPASVVDRHIDDKGPTAASVAGLFDDLGGTASREACAVRAAQRMRAPGYVIVAECDGVVRFAARSQTALPIARGTPQDELHPLAVAGRRGSSRQSNVTLVHGTSWETDPMHADCIRHDDYVFGVFTVGAPAWTVAFSGLRVPDHHTPDHFCGRCQEPFDSFDPACTSCRERRCPECGWCACHDHADDDLTPCRDRGCGLSWPAARLVDGLCPDCR